MAKGHILTEAAAQRGQSELKNPGVLENSGFKSGSRTRDERVRFGVYLRVDVIDYLDNRTTTVFDTTTGLGQLGQPLEDIKRWRLIH